MNSPLARSHKLTTDYTSADIEVLEGIEPVRRRPSMFVGSTDEHGLHHLAAELLDNAMDEIVAGAASRIDIELAKNGIMRVSDNGRGIPVDPHPKFIKRSALEIIMTTLHSGGKFGNEVYQTSGGLHGVGLSVVNALSEWLEIEVSRDGRLWIQQYEKGSATSKLEAQKLTKQRGTTIRFRPDTGIFGKDAAFDPERIYQMARAKAYLFAGTEVRWYCDKQLIEAKQIPEKHILRFPGGLEEYLTELVGELDTVTCNPFSGRTRVDGESGGIEWAIHWTTASETSLDSYCNTVPTPDGGTHETGFRAALIKGLKEYGKRINNRRATHITSDDILSGARGFLSLFVQDPQFFGQTKTKLSNPDASRMVEGIVRDHFDHWLSGAPAMATALLETVLSRTEDRLAKREERQVARRSATHKSRLPGKLSDCSRKEASGTELFLVEGDSAGGSAKQARDRETQAVLPLRGKILNVVSAARAKLKTNQEIADLIQALGCGSGSSFSAAQLRYDKIIIMTDADVDGMHIAALLMTFFYHELPGLITSGHLYLAQPPLYRLSRGSTTVYARDDADKESLIKNIFSGSSTVGISRFKGLGEMPAPQLRETTMNRQSRHLLQVTVPEGTKNATDTQVERLMGRKPELRLAFIQERAPSVESLDV